MPNAAYRHFASRDELLAAVCTAALRELAARMAAGVARVPGQYGDPEAARSRSIIPLARSVAMAITVVAPNRTA